MSSRVRLLGRPALEVDGGHRPGPRGHKAWGLLAYLVLVERPPGRARVCELLFDDAEDPRGALRWNLTELRRAGAGLLAVDGDPLELRWAPGVELDVARPDGAGQLLEGLDFEDAPRFAGWLDGERRARAARRRTAAVRSAAEQLAVGRPSEAARTAMAALEDHPLDDELHTLAVSGLARSGDVAAARVQVARCADLFRRELGLPPPPGVRAALAVQAVEAADGPVVVRALLGAADAALASGAVEVGIDRLRRAVATAPPGPLAARARLELASALVHARGARGADVLTLLHEARAGAVAAADARVGATACAELAFLAVQRGQRAEVEHWLAEAGAWPVVDVETSPLARILGLRGMSLTDVGAHGGALAVLHDSVAAATTAGQQRQATWSRSMLGRALVLHGDAGQGASVLDRVLEEVRGSRWTAFLPWPATFRAEAALALGDTASARRLLDEAWVLAVESGDQCWVSTVAHGQVVLAHAVEGPAAAARWCRAGLAASPWYVWPRVRLLARAARLYRGADQDAVRAELHELTAASGLDPGTGLPDRG